MNAGVEFHGLSFNPRGPVLTGIVERGRKVAVVGESASGKSRLLRCVLQVESPARGRVQLSGPAVPAGLEGAGSRATPQTIARRLAGPSSATPIAEALSACRLWEVRHAPISSLPAGRRAACELLPCLLQRASVLVVDGVFDRLDPWTASEVFSALDAKLRAGAVLVFATNDLSLAEAADDVIVMRKGSPVFFGSLDALLNGDGPALLEVETENRPGVRALVDPLTVQIEEREGGMTMRVPDGGETAVKLLLQGYGDVKLVAVLRPRLRDVLMDRFGG